jgi:hypothetical protein
MECRTIRARAACRGDNGARSRDTLFREHQDSSGYQHSVAMALLSQGARLRVFGDPMQKILKAEVKKDSDLVSSWKGIRRETGKTLAEKIPFSNTVKYIFVFKEGLNHGSWFRLKNAVLTDARNIRSVQDSPGSTFLSDPLS